MQTENALKIGAIIDYLENVQKRPQMFIGAVTEVALFGFLTGFHAACEILGSPQEEYFYWQVCAERGWEINALGPQKWMRDADWAETAIVAEMLVIEVETWKRMLLPIEERYTRPLGIHEAGER